MQVKIADFVNFCKTKVYMHIVGLVIILSYGLLIFNVSIGIDDENMDYYLSGGLIAQDRIGWTISNQFFPSYQFLPLWTVVVGIVFMTLGVLFWVYGLDKAFNNIFSRGVITALIACFISFPYIAKFAIFNGNMVAMGYVLCLTSIALYASYDLWNGISIKSFIVAVLCLGGVFLFEKAYIIFFCQGIIAFLLLKQSFDRAAKLLQIIKWGAMLGVSIVISYALAKGLILLAQYHMGILASNYTLNYIKYDLSSVSAFLISIKNFLISYFLILLNNINFYYGEKVYVLSIVVMLVLTSYNSIKKRNFYILFWCVISILLSSSMYFITGNIYMPIRTICFNYAFFIGITFLYLSCSVELKNGLALCFYILVFLIIGNQSREMEEIYYNKYITYEKDKKMAELVLTEIEKECGILTTYKKPIVFLGFPNNYNINYGEAEDTSIFVWDRNSNVSLEETSERIYNFYDELGYYLERPSQKNIDFYYLRKEISDMNSFPLEGFVKEEEECIIVKLGDSLCEIMNFDDSLYTAKGNLLGNIEGMDYVNNVLNLKGWLIKVGHNSYANNISLILVNNEKGYKLRIDEDMREDITVYMADGVNYDNSGFDAILSLPEYISTGSYKVYLELLDDEEKYLYDMGQNIVVD